MQQRMVEQYPGLTGDVLARMMRLVGQDIGDSARWRHGRTAAAISAATHCLEQYNSGDLVSPSTADRSPYATLRHPPHASSGWG